MRCLTCALAAAVAVTLVPAATAAPLPNLVAVANVTTVKTFRPDGTAAATLPATTFASLGDTRVAIDAGSGGDDVVDVRDSRTGNPRYAIPNAFRGIVLPEGQVAFWPGRNGVRDPFGDSIWIRLRDGRIRKLLQLPGGDDTLLSTSFDGTARRLVVANGNDVDLFSYDVWLRDRKTAKTRRLTRDRHSRWPVLRSDGKVVAYTHEHGLCAAGVRASDVVLLTLSTGRKRVLTRGSCTRTYPQPVFLTNGSLVSFRGRRVGGAWHFDLIRVATATGRRTVVPGSGGAASFSVSQTQRLLAFAGRDRGQGRRPEPRHRAGAADPVRPDPGRRSAELAATAAGATRPRGQRVQATTTPARLIAPPTSARGPGASPSSHQAMAPVSGGTRYVVAASRPAGERASAYAQVVNAIAVGNSPRYSSHTNSGPSSRGSSSTRAGANGRHRSAPATVPMAEAASGETRATTGFCSTTPVA